MEIKIRKGCSSAQHMDLHCNYVCWPMTVDINLKRVTIHKWHQRGKPHEIDGDVECSTFLLACMTNRYPAEVNRC